MEIDIKTVVLIIGITRLMQVFVFYHQYRATSNLRGPGWWVMWSAADFVGSIIVLLRSLPAFLPYVIIFQNVIIASGAVFVYIGVMSFFEKKVSLKVICLLILTYLILHLFFIYIIDDVNIRTLLLYITISVSSFLVAITFYRNKTRAIFLTANLNAVIFTLRGVIYGVRVVMILSGIPSPRMLAPDNLNYLIYFDALIVGLLWTFGFIILLNQKLNSDISEAKTHFEHIFNTSPDAVIISRAGDGMFVDCNESYYKISGYTKADISGNSFLHFNLWKNPEDRAKLVNQIDETGFCENMEVLFQRKDGEVFTGLLSAKKITFNEIPHIMSVTRDITDRKKAEENIRHKNEELHKTNVEKDKFFSIIAHDLRSPFMGFLGLTEIMAEDVNSLSKDELSTMSKELNKNAKNLFNLLKNLLEWAQMQRGTTSFNPIVISLSAVISRNIELIAKWAEQKGVEILNEVTEFQTVYADEAMLDSIIRNLLVNAVKFTEHGGKVIIGSKESTNGTLEVFVKDTGIGMSKALSEMLFKIEEKVGRKGTDGEESTGLGLLLCKEFVEKNEGKIWVESEEGRGSVFYFTIPANMQQLI